MSDRIKFIEDLIALAKRENCYSIKSGDTEIYLRDPVPSPEAEARDNDDGKVGPDGLTRAEQRDLYGYGGD